MKLGQRKYLAKLPVTTMQATLPGRGIAPGEKSPLVVTFTQPDGTVWQTEGKGKGKILWQDLQVSATVAQVNSKGVLSLDADPRMSDGQTPHVVITAPSHPDLRAELDVPVRYDYQYRAAFQGASGFSGMSGTNGIDGTDGMPGSLDPNNPSPGGNGSNGGDGTSGTDGGPGSDGPAVLVQVALRDGVHPLLQVAVTAQGKQRLYMVDPQGGSITVTSLGGAGGSGGKGGKGGRGGSGGIGSPNGSSGHSGSDGQDGRDGSSGRDGRITVVYDPSVRPFLSTIRLPGTSSPVWREETVGPLW